MKRATCRGCGLGAEWIPDDTRPDGGRWRGDRDVDPCPGGGSDFHEWVAAVVCPECSGEVQFTRKTYWSIIDGSLEQQFVGDTDTWDAYCENDHQLGEFEAYPEQVVEIARSIESGI